MDEKAARQFAGYVDVPLIEVTRADADGFRGDRIALDALSFRIPLRPSAPGLSETHNHGIRYLRGREGKESPCTLRKCTSGLVQEDIPISLGLLRTVAGERKGVS